MNTTCTRHADYVRFFFVFRSSYMVYLTIISAKSANTLDARDVYRLLRSPHTNTHDSRAAIQNPAEQQEDKKHIFRVISATT